MSWCPQLRRVPGIALSSCGRVFPYGLLCYDIFTLVTDRALLVFEQALRDRFIDFHQGTVTFADPGPGRLASSPQTDTSRSASSYPATGGCD